MIRRQGVMGCLVVMIAIMGTVAGGFALAVVEHTETTTEWSYVTEIAGLFDGETDVPTFTEYSPSYNWTGWSSSSYDGGVYTGGTPSATSDAPYSMIYVEDISEAAMSSSEPYTVIYVANGSTVTILADGAWEATALSNDYYGLSIVSDDDATSSVPAGSVTGTLTHSAVTLYITVSDGTDEYSMVLGIVTAVTDNTSGISFTTQSETNGYPIIASSNELGVSIDLTKITSTVEFEYATGILGAKMYTYGILVNPDSEDADLSTSSADGLIWLPDVVSMADVLDYYADWATDYETVTIYTGADAESPIIARGWSGNSSTSDWQKTNHSSIGFRNLTYYTLSVFTDTATMVSYITVDLSTNIVTAYNVNGDYLWTSDVENTWIAWGGTDEGGLELRSVGVKLSVGKLMEIDETELTGAATYDAETVYMKIADGVSIAITDSSEYVTWTNAQRNGAIQILFSLSDTTYDTSNQLIFPVNDLYGLPVSTTEQYALQLIVSYIASSGTTTVSLAYGVWDGTTFTTVDSLAAGVSIGTWKNFVVSLDTSSGEYAIHPVTSFTSFIDYEVSAAAFSLDLDVSGLTFSRILWMGTSESFTVGVVSTSVWLNTYDTVLLDPTLDIQNWFPDVDDLRINFYSFALYGDSITINGVEYEVSGSYIYIDTEAGTVSEELVNFYIVYEGGHTLLTFVNSGTTYDLGVTVDYTISMSGMWYFAAALWEGETVETTISEWAAGEYYAFDWTESLVICCGLMLVGTAVGWKVNRGMKWLDLAIIIGSAVVVWVLTGLEVFRWRSQRREPPLRWRSR